MQTDDVGDIYIDYGYIKVLLWLFFFFFQAEDGIRDLTVTGVQTCALPICPSLPSNLSSSSSFFRVACAVSPCRNKSIACCPYPTFTLACVATAPTPAIAHGDRKSVV